MTKTILVTGSTDGIGLSTVKMLAEKGHNVLVHGRSPEKVHNVVELLSDMNSEIKIDGFVADLSAKEAVEELAKEIEEKYSKIDVLINNAGVFAVPNPTTVEGLDVRFAVNTIAPYLLTKRLLHLMNSQGRVVNLSSAAQATVNLDALAGKGKLDDNSAYAQSKLALTMWSRYMALELDGDGPLVVSVNPKSFLGSKMVKQAYGMAGHDINIGGDILCRAALSDEFADANAKYFDNDRGVFAMPHPDALDDELCESVVNAIEALI